MTICKSTYLLYSFSNTKEFHKLQIHWSRVECQTIAVVICNENRALGLDKDSFYMVTVGLNEQFDKTKQNMTEIRSSSW